MPTQDLVASDPETLGPYRLVRRLGSGGMGVVYLGTGGPGGREVAVKCLPPGVGPDVRSRLGREADFLVAVRHPRVAAFVSADTQASRPWIAMQYVAGPSLAQASVPLGPVQVRHLAEGLADALAALHRQGLTHRDVKPGNVILTHDGPVLVDLGIAAGAGLTSLTAVGMVVGTPEWMAPEQLIGTGSGHATDLWGWAATVAYAATGRPPFGTGAIEALAHRIRHEQPDLTRAPDWLRGALIACLAKDAARRPTAAHLAAVDGVRRVGAAVVPVPPPAPPMTPARPGPPPVRTMPARGPVQAPVIRPPVARPAIVPPASRSPVSRPPVPRPPVAPAAARPARSDRSSRTARAAGPAPVPAPPPARRRPSFVRRVVRRLVWTLVLVLVALVVAGLVFTWVSSAVGGGSWRDAVRDLGDTLGRLLR